MFVVGFGHHASLASLLNLFVSSVFLAKFIRSVGAMCVYLIVSKDIYEGFARLRRYAA